MIGNLRVVVTGTPGYDDGISLGAALDALFDKAPLNGLMIVVSGHENCAGPEGIAREWAKMMIDDGMPVGLEDWSGDDLPSRPARGLLAIRPGDEPGRLQEQAMLLGRYGIPLEIITQGRALGLPESMIGSEPGGHVLHQVIRRSLRESSSPTSQSRPGSGLPHRER